MPLPQEFPNLAVQQVISFVTQKDKDQGRLALAVYELAGYGLKLKYGDPKYLMQADHELIQMAAKFTEDDFKKIMEDLPKYASAAAKAYKMKEEGKGWFQIAMAILMEFGPEVLALIVKIFAK